MTTTVEPRGISFAVLMAPHMAAPELIPQKRPSRIERSRVVMKASSSEQVSLLSSRPGSYIFGTIAYCMFFNTWMRWSSVGSMPMIFTFGFCSFRNIEQPMRVPVVPIPATKASTSPFVCCMISGPVVR